MGVPTNHRKHKKLDCAVFNLFYEDFATEGAPIDSARAAYVPTAASKRVWEGSWISEDTHIQICVRNTKNILAVWHVRPDGRYGKKAKAPGEG